jgi:hypothetical protein
MLEWMGITECRTNKTNLWRPAHISKVEVVFQFGCIKKAGLVKHTHMDFAFDLLEVENR